MVQRAHFVQGVLGWVPAFTVWVPGLVPPPYDLSLGTPLAHFHDTKITLIILTQDP